MPPALFVLPDWNAPVDLAAYLAGVPANAAIKGVFPSAVVAAAQAKNVRLTGIRPKYHPFADIPIREYLPVLVEAAVGMYPDLSTREALRKMGRASRNAIEQSTFGRIMMANFLDLRSNLALMGKIASIATPGARFTLEELVGQRARISFSNVYTFADSHHIGIFEKLASATKVRVESRVRMQTAYDGELEITW